MVRYGRALAEATAPEATIAVVWAGAIPYVADRPAVDVLGKNDPVVARAGHRWVAQPSYLGGAGFVPGHTRWDYDWSIRQARPDVIAQVFQLTDDDRRAFAAWGYEAVAPGVYVQAGSTRVDRARLATAAATVPRRLLEIDLACDLLASAPTDQRPAMEADAGHCASRGVPPPAPPRP
jgi:hypothetical protein